MELSLRFDHGLGDCANFAHILELYRRRGYVLNLHCADDKAFVFAPLHVNRIPLDYPGLMYVDFPEPVAPNPEIAGQYWLYNKAAINVTGGPLPEIGTPEQLWPELCSVKFDFDPYITNEHRWLVDEFLRGLARPIVLIHSMGNTSGHLKNLPTEVTIELYRQLLDRMGGTIVLLDWDDRVPRLANWRVRHMTDDWRWIEVPTLIELMRKADLLICVDSGPLHLARMTDIPIVGVFFELRQHPARVSLPRGRTVNVVPRDVMHECNLKSRILSNVVESPGGSLDPTFIADVSWRMLEAPRYLSPDLIGADVQLQQFALEWQWRGTNTLTEYCDRHRGYDILLSEICKRFVNPIIVETGCIRSQEDWSAGYGTYLLGALTHRIGGHVFSVDIDASCCDFARQATSELNSVTVITQDSVPFLAQFGKTIDVLVLDSMDTWFDGYEMHALREAQEGSRWLHDRSLIVFDDTVYKKKAFHGKGALAVPWLLERGWQILHSGYQTILTRNSSNA